MPRTKTPRKATRSRETCVEEGPAAATHLCTEREGHVTFTVYTVDDPAACGAKFLIEAETEHPDAACDFGMAYCNDVKRGKASLLKEMMLDLDDEEDEP